MAYQKTNPPTFVSENLWKCTKAKATFQLKAKIILVFKPKLKVAFAFAFLESVSKEIDRLENLQIIATTDYLEWSDPPVYVKKKKTILLGADFSSGLNETIGHEDIFTKSKGWNVPKIKLFDMYLLIEVD